MAESPIAMDEDDLVRLSLCFYPANRGEKSRDGDELLREYLHQDGARGTVLRELGLVTRLVGDGSGDSRNKEAEIIFLRRALLLGLPDELCRYEEDRATGLEDYRLFLLKALRPTFREVREYNE